jgi:hypothetical protein
VIEQERSRYIVSPAYDWVFFLLPPLAALAIGIAIANTRFTESTFPFAGQKFTAAEMMIGTIIQAHLVAVLLRSHGNKGVRRRYPVRFFVVPVVLWIAIATSAKIAVAATVVATFWDVWHSGAQTFGLARIYDRNMGNPPDKGRRLDLWINQLLYAGPILAGVSLLDHVQHLNDFDDVGVMLFSTAPVYIAGHQRYVAWAVIGAGSALLVIYVATFIRLHLQGYRVSRFKVFLVATTGACSIYSWGLNSWGEAFFIMNLFHAVQYLALVWHTERPTLMRALRLGPSTAAKGLCCAAYLGALLAYGFLAELVDSRRQALWAVTIVISLMHFWYDGFVWSVRRQEV